MRILGQRSDNHLLFILRRTFEVNLSQYLTDEETGPKRSNKGIVSLLT